MEHKCLTCHTTKHLLNLQHVPQVPKNVCMTFIFQNVYKTLERYGRDNKVRELATVCLLWQHWTKALVWFDDADVSAFHSCVVVDLWQTLSGIYYCLRVFWCATPRMSELELEQRMHIKFLVVS